MSSVKSKTWLITGASRGIGLAMTKSLLIKGHRVIAACRNPEGARDLWELQNDYKTRFKYVKLDVSDPQSIVSCARELGDEVIDVLVNNAGVLKGADETITSINFADITKSFEVNTIGPMRVAQALLPNLLKSTCPKVANISSKMGSISDNKSGGYYSYRMSKAALNMFTSSFAIECPQIIALTLHPGWVKTEMGGGQAPLEAEDSVEGLIQVIENATKRETGRFFEYTGKGLSW